VDGADVAAYAAGEFFLTKTIENATEKAEDGESESWFSFFKDPWEQGVWVLHPPINIKNGKPKFGSPPPLGPVQLHFKETPPPTAGETIVEPFLERVATRRNKKSLRDILRLM
jgi:hypothetical protein